jgi:hypothetical protein
MADGSVHFIGDDIDIGNFVMDGNGKYLPEGMGVWQRLNASGDGLTFDETVLGD